MKNLLKYIPYLFGIFALVCFMANAFPVTADYVPMLSCLQAPEGYALGICATACAVTVPPAAYNDCLSVSYKAGGIKRAVYSACNASWTLTDGTAWNTALTANDVRATGRIVGQKPKGTTNKKKVDSVSPEIVIGGTQSVTYRDYNVTAESYTFYNTLKATPNKFRFGFLDSTDDFFGFFDNISIEADVVKEEDSENGSSYWDVAVFWTGTATPAPVAIEESYLDPA